MNKRALAEELLPLVAGAMAALALMSFLSYAHEATSISSDVSALIAQTKFSQEYVEQQVKLITKETILSCQECDVDGLAATMITRALDREKIYPNENTRHLAGMISAGDFILIQEPDQKYRLQLPLSGKEPITIQVTVGDNHMARKVPICMFFDAQGKFISDC